MSETSRAYPSLRQIVRQEIRWVPLAYFYPLILVLTYGYRAVWWLLICLTPRVETSPGTPGHEDFHEWDSVKELRKLQQYNFRRLLLTMTALPIILIVIFLVIESESLKAFWVPLSVCVGLLLGIGVTLYEYMLRLMQIEHQVSAEYHHWEGTIKMLQNFVLYSEHGEREEMQERLERESS